MSEKKESQIIINKNGPYQVVGEIPLVRKSQVVSEYGEPITWHKEQTLETDAEAYYLCRCGNSQNVPFCDGSHRRVGFDGTETQQSQSTMERRFEFPGGTKLVVRKDTTLCMDSGFCGFLNLPIKKIVPNTDDTKMRSLVIAMVERCPSGSLTYSIPPEEKDIEPDLPVQVAITTEITDDGAIIGPLWVTGNVIIEQSDGSILETRNRVTLCNCGRSEIKPLCDGTHRKYPRFWK
jgi:CDGSH-type Zn-finger protein